MSTGKETTKDHLVAALAFESVANRKYAYFAKLARELGDAEAAQLFESISQDESTHAFAQLTLMYPPGAQTVVALLRLACELEKSETQHQYPRYAADARSEQGAAATQDVKGFLTQAERRFEALAEKELSHLKRFEELLKVRVAGQARAGSSHGENSAEG